MKYLYHDSLLKFTLSSSRQLYLFDQLARLKELTLWKKQLFSSLPSRTKSGNTYISAFSNVKDLLSSLTTSYNTKLALLTGCLNGGSEKLRTYAGTLGLCRKIVTLGGWTFLFMFASYF